MREFYAKFYEKLNCTTLFTVTPMTECGLCNFIFDTSKVVQYTRRSPVRLPVRL